MAEVNFERFTNFNRTDAELEHLLFFSIAVAGKNASITSRAINRFFEGYDFFTPGAASMSPYDVINLRMGVGTLRKHLERARLGKYNAIIESSRYIIHNGIEKRLRACPLSVLESVPYLGMKTARMILLHSRPKQRMIPLDTHILKFLRDELALQSAPKSTPGSKQHPKAYLFWEGEFLKWIEHCEQTKAQGFTVRGKFIPFNYYDDGTIRICDVDLQIWLAYRVDTKERT
jgi:hypothetical protein